MRTYKINNSEAGSLNLETSLPQLGLQYASMTNFSVSIPACATNDFDSSSNFLFVRKVVFQNISERNALFGPGPLHGY